MSLTNIKLKNQGFTIVELLIVVVVIAILAAITIVSYNGITNRANAAAAQETATSVQKKAELYNSDCTNPPATNCKGYPVTLGDMQASAVSGTSYYLSGNVNATTTPGTAPSASNGKNTIQYQPCGTGGSGSAAALTTVAGAKITWWDFTKSSGQATTITVGDTSGTCATTA